MLGWTEEEVSGGRWDEERWRRGDGGGSGKWGRIEGESRGTGRERMIVDGDGRDNEVREIARRETGKWMKKKMTENEKLEQG